MNPIDKVLGKLNDARETGSGWQALCPAHEDRTPSLSITEGDDGRVLLHCHAGCATDAILAALRLRPRDLFPKRARERVIFRARGRREIADTYQYRDEKGELRFEVVRYLPKDFRQRRPDGHGGYLPNLRGVARVLYKLPELLEAKPGRFVFVSEGEKDADAIAKLGLVATTTSGGAGKAGLTDLDPLHGRKVVICADADEPGRKHAQELAQLLHGKAAGLRVLEVPGHKDAADWIEAGGSKSELLRLAKSAPQWKPVDAHDDLDDEDGLIARRLCDIPPENIEWLWPERFALGVIGLLYGQPAQGKSTVLADIIARVTTAAPWPDETDNPAQPTPGSVLLLDAENHAAQVLVPRLIAAGADLSRVTLIEGARQEGRERGCNLVDDLAALEEQIERAENCRVIVIDPVSAYLGGVEENANAEIRAVFGPVARLAERHRVAVICVTHPRKAAGGTALDAVLGSKAFGALARTAFLVTEDPKDRSRRLLVGTKSNLGENHFGLAFEIKEGSNGAPRVVWETLPVLESAEQILRELKGGDGRTRAQRCVTWLRDRLRDGPVAADAIRTAAEAEGFGRRVLDVAANAVNVAKKKKGLRGGWVWSLPSEGLPLEKICTSSSSSVFSSDNVEDARGDQARTFGDDDARATPEGAEDARTTYVHLRAHLRPQRDPRARVRELDLYARELAAEESRMGKLAKTNGHAAGVGT